MILKLQCASQSPGGLVKAQIAAPAPQASDPAGLGQGLGICILTCSQGMLMLPIQGHTLRTTDLHGILGQHNVCFFLKKGNNSTEAEDPKTIILSFRHLFSIRPADRVAPDPIQGPDLPAQAIPRCDWDTAFLALLPHRSLSKVALPPSF